MDENWKQISGYRTYWVSNRGSVKTTDYNHTKKEKKLNVFRNVSGYAACNLMQDGKRHRKLVHRLVCIAFIENPNGCPEVNHIDGNKMNNDVSNLEWCTSKQNSIHAHKSGLVKVAKGEKHYKSYLSSEQISIMKRMIAEKMKGRTIANIFGVGEKYVSSVKRGKSRVNG